MDVVILACMFFYIFYKKDWGKLRLTPHNSVRNGADPEIVHFLKSAGGGEHNISEDTNYIIPTSEKITDGMGIGYILYFSKYILCSKG